MDFVCRFLICLFFYDNFFKNPLIHEKRLEIKMICKINKMLKSINHKEDRHNYVIKLFEDSKDTIDTIFKKDGNILGKLITITKILVENINSTPFFTGQDKKDLVISVIFKIIDDDHGPLDRFDDIIKPIVSSAIDELIYVGKNGLTLSPLRKNESVSCLCFAGYIKKIFICPKKTIVSNI